MATPGHLPIKYDDDAAFDLPELAAHLVLEDDTRFLTAGDTSVGEVFAVKFCPYQPMDADPVFAAVSKKHVAICKLWKDYNSGTSVFKTIKLIRDDDDGVSNCCCTWTRDPITGVPYICVAGFDGIVKVYDIIQEKLVESFTGHGGGINDLATSPVDPAIIASASDDTTVRIWTLDPKHREQPCLCILGGEGHIAEVLTAAFHDNGTFLLTGGHDHRINLWTLPELPTECREAPIQVHYPHFSTSAVHGGIVDCVAFYGDYILSKAHQDNIIVLWEILGFSSEDPPPEESIAPLPQIPRPHDHPATQFTRSAFVPTVSAECPLQYDRRMQFHTPKCGEMFFLRFQLHLQPDQHPILVFANPAGEIFMWDLERIRAYNDLMARINDPNRSKNEPVRLPKWLGRLRAPNNGKPVSSGKGSQRGSQTPEIDSNRIVYDISDINPRNITDWQARYSVTDRDHALEPHSRTEVDIRGGDFNSGKGQKGGPRRYRVVKDPLVGRQASWSPGGEWCVVVGSQNMILVLRRWKKM
ncbi:unnamed protein product [Clonostachys chloroleuca]|uniref:Polycomb protein EED n=1 Tax=Clonostachys chloroleuca TaxID=1926264 RepID=A0AA35Q698_9HYPO|nr:unnamed protein product [Clonostachys chloroleuca]